MAQLKLGAIKDLGGIGGFTFTSSGITANGTLTVTDIVIDGNISGSSAYILPNPSGQSGNFVTNNGSTMSWGGSVRDLYINDRDSNDMRSISSLAAYEIRG